MIEKKVYSSWAFTDDYNEKAKVNREIYEELCEKYKISRHKVDNLDDYDLVVDGSVGYGQHKYYVVKNTTPLSKDEVALICDGGNLCFGYTEYWGNYHIFTD